MDTCDTAGTSSSMLWCAKIQYCTHTHGPRFGSTAGLPIPVQNPKEEEVAEVDEEDYK